MLTSVFLGLGTGGRHAPNRYEPNPRIPDLIAAAAELRGITANRIATVAERGPLLRDSLPVLRGRKMITSTMQ